MRLAVNELSPDILCASETWLKQETPDSLVNIHGYKIIRNDRSYLNNIGSVKKGGGVCFFIKEKYSCLCQEQPELNYSTQDIETQTIKISLPNTRPIYITNIYRPPGGNLEIAFQTLQKIVDFPINAKPHEHFMGGDINVDYQLNNATVRKLKKL